MGLHHRPPATDERSIHGSCESHERPELRGLIGAASPANRMFKAPGIAIQVRRDSGSSGRAARKGTDRRGRGAAGIKDVAYET